MELVVVGVTVVGGAVLCYEPFDSAYRVCYRPGRIGDPAAVPAELTPVLRVADLLDAPDDFSRVRPQAVAP